MARIRTIKPEFPQSESMGNVSREARLLFILLWPVCDDEGKARGSARLLASLLFPYDADAPALIDGWLDELSRENCIVRYEVGGAHYVRVVKWGEHQKIDRASPSKIPDPSNDARELSSTTREPSTQDQGPKDQGPKDRGPGKGPGPREREQEEAGRLWQEAARVEGWPEVGLLNSMRRQLLQARLAQCGGIEGWKLALEKARQAEFLRTPDGKPQRWFDLDWLLDEQKFTKVMEGRYAKRHRSDGKPGVGSTLAAYAEFARETSG